MGNKARTFRDARRDGPADRPATPGDGPPRRGQGGSADAFFLPEWLPAWAAYCHRRLKADESDDGPEESGDSPWLEEGRKWNARRARLKYEEERGLLVRTEHVQRVFQLIAQPLRDAADNFCESDRVLHEAALDRATQRLDEEFPPVDDRPSDSDADDSEPCELAGAATD